MLTKSLAAVLFPVAWLAYLFAARGPKGFETRRLARDIGIATGVALLICGWWLVRNQILYGDLLAQRAFLSAFVDRPSPQLFMHKIRPHAALLRPPRHRLDLRQHLRRLRPAPRQRLHFLSDVDLRNRRRRHPPCDHWLPRLSEAREARRLAASILVARRPAGPAPARRLHPLQLLLLPGPGALPIPRSPRRRGRHRPRPGTASPSSLRSLGLAACCRGAPGLSLLGPLLLDRAALPAGKSGPELLGTPRPRFHHVVSV